MDRFGVVHVVVLAWAAAGCRNDGGGERPVPSASALAVSSIGPDVPGDPIWSLSLDPASRARVEMPGIKEHIVGETTHADGTIDVAPRDLTRSRGNIRIDLATFETHTFGSEQDATQTRHARTWLEVQVGDALREDMRWAQFAIRSIDGASARDLTQVPPRREGDDDVRSATMTVHGDLLIHGHSVPKDDVVEVTFHHRAGAPIDALPTRVSVVSKEPMRVVLKEHDVRPRDPAGQLLQWTAQLISKVADTADVTVTLGANPTP